MEYSALVRMMEMHLKFVRRSSYDPVITVYIISGGGGARGVVRWCWVTSSAGTSYKFGLVG